MRVVGQEKSGRPDQGSGSKCPSKGLKGTEAIGREASAVINMYAATARGPIC